MRLSTTLLSSTLLASSMLAAAPALAQASGEEEARSLDTIVVTARTGSRIKRQGDLPSPLSTVSQADFSDNAVKDVRDLIGILPSNNGSQNNSDSLAQNFTPGTANINLRGLGVASTLVLLNGKRQVLSSAVTNDGATFVDLNALVPTLAIERVEILKDGASAIYGSDAVAGVANFITRENFEGMEIVGEFRTRAQEGSQRDWTIDAVIGNQFADGRGDFLIAASYLNRTSIGLDEVSWDGPVFSGFGQPGSFVVPAGNPLLPPSLAATGGTVADPGCEANDGNLITIPTGSTICLFNFGPAVQFVPDEDRLQGYAKASYDIADTLTFWGEIGYARNEIVRNGPTSFPVLNTPVVPANNPGNIFGEDVFFQGRPFGSNVPFDDNFFEHTTVRAAFGLDGQIGDNYSWDISYVRAINDSVLNPRDTIVDNFQAALQGFGGVGCDTGPTAAVPAVAGENGCLFFNPFSSAFDAPPGSPLANDPSLANFIIGDFIADGESQLNVVEANLTGSLFEMSGGQAGFAVGAQYRDQSLETRFDSVAQQDGFGLLIGNPNYAGEIDVWALYGEVLLPVTDWVEVTGALRYENYGSEIGDTVDPKVAVLARPHDTLSLRGSWSTSFRAPSVFQAQGVQTSFINIIDFTGSAVFAGNRTVGNPDLQPETSRTFNFGGTWAPLDNVEINLDYWNVSFEDVLAQENAQAIVDADPFDPRVRRTSAGSISIVNTAFINAEAIDVSGLDIGARAAFDTSLGTISPFAEVSLLLSYDVTSGGVTVDGLGRLNRTNVGSPNQQFKGNFGVNWSSGPASANIIVRHIGGYEDDAGVGIDNFTTLDFNATYDLGSVLLDDSSSYISVGVVNATGENPPFVDILGSYDPRSADPRGRRVFVKVGTSF